jgi:hypothetical protein
MRIALTGPATALAALPMLVALSCSPREGTAIPGTTTTQGGSGGGAGSGAQGGAGGHAGAGAQGGGGASNLCVLDQSNVNECVLAP